MALTQAQVITQALARCGNRGSDTTLQAIATTEVLLIQQELEQSQTLPWYLLATTTLTVTANTATVSVPTDFLRETNEDEGALFWNDTTVTPAEKIRLRKAEYAFLVDKYRGASAGTPEMYALVGSSFITFPTSNVNGTCELGYYAATTTLGASGSTNVWTTYSPSLVVAALAEKLAGEYIQDYPLEQRHKAVKDREYARLVLNETARSEAGASRMMGEN